MTSYDDRYKKFFQLFNERDFYECHEVLEDLWMETTEEERPYYQGLIQTATAFYKIECGNMGGARKLFESGLNYLKPFPASYMSFDLATYRATCAEWLERVRRKAHGEDIELNEDHFPVLEFPTVH